MASRCLAPSQAPSERAKIAIPHGRARRLALARHVWGPAAHVTRSTLSAKAVGPRRAACRRLAPVLTSYGNRSTSQLRSTEAETVGGSGAVDGLKESYSRLQNGSDIRGVALEGIPGESVTLTEEHAFHIGAAYADVLSRKLARATERLRVAIGRDPRLSGPALQRALAAGLASRGVAIGDGGLATTPAMFMACILPRLNFDGAVMLTASHLPYNRNGFKFFTKSGGADKADISAILAGAAAEAANSPGTAIRALSGPQQSCNVVAVLPLYSAHLVDVIRKAVRHPTNYDTPLSGFKVVVDAGNGSGGYFVDYVLQPLGADTRGSQFLVPDGTFPNHVPNPEDKVAMAAAVKATVEANAALGIIFDTDVDRSGVVDEKGAAINRNRLIALMAAIVLREHRGTTVVTDSVTSNGLARFIEAQGGKHLRYRRGYKNVIDKGIELNARGVETHLMMETSGHGAVRENYFLDDGAYSAVKILVEMVRRRLSKEPPIGDLVAALPEPKEEAEVRLPLRKGDYKEIAASVLAKLRAWVESDNAPPGWQLEAANYEGWRVRVPEGPGAEGWFLLRSSLHDPLLALNVESEMVGGVASIARHLHEGFFGGSGGPIDGVDLAPLAKLAAR